MIRASPLFRTVPRLGGWIVRARARRSPRILTYWNAVSFQSMDLFSESSRSCSVTVSSSVTITDFMRQRVHMWTRDEERRRIELLKDFILDLAVAGDFR